MIRCNFTLSFASLTASDREQPQQSTMSSIHLPVGLLGGRLPSTIRNKTVFTNRWSFILQMWPNNFNFLRLCLYIMSVMLSLLTLSLQDTFNILLTSSAYPMPVINSPWATVLHSTDPVTLSSSMINANGELDRPVYFQSLPWTSQLVLAQFLRATGWQHTC